MVIATLVFVQMATGRWLRVNGNGKKAVDHKRNKKHLPIELFIMRTYGSIRVNGA